jgi:hypothetical protein
VSYREQHDAEFTSYIEQSPMFDINGERWSVVYKGVPQGVFRTREEARKRIRSLKPFSRYQPLTAEESAKLDVAKRPWGRFTRILRDVYDLDPVYDQR